jgi:hypothetical protein
MKCYGGCGEPPPPHTHNALWGDEREVRSPCVVLRIWWVDECGVARRRIPHIGDFIGVVCMLSFSCSRWREVMMGGSAIACEWIFWWALQASSIQIQFLLPCRVKSLWSRWCPNPTDRRVWLVLVLMYQSNHTSFILYFSSFSCMCPSKIVILYSLVL